MSFQDYFIFCFGSDSLKFADLFLGYTFGIYETVRIYRADWRLHTDIGKDQLPTFPLVLFIFQVGTYFHAWAQCIILCTEK